MEETKMSPQAKDGSSHHSFGRAKLHDDMESDRKAKAGPKSMMAPKKESKGEAEPKAPKESEAGTEHENMEAMPDTPTPIEQHVSQHGPADEMHHKMGADGMHHVHSMHGGQAHKSTHSTFQDAHMHMGKAGGAAALADGGGMSPVAPPPAAPGGGIPGMM
jgi:hypothetical protein